LAECFNVVGSFHCACNTGFSGNGFQCSVNTFQAIPAGVSSILSLPLIVPHSSIVAVGSVSAFAQFLPYYFALLLNISTFNVIIDADLLQNGVESPSCLTRGFPPPFSMVQITAAFGLDISNFTLLHTLRTICSNCSVMQIILDEQPPFVWDDSGTSAQVTGAVLPCQNSYALSCPSTDSSSDLSAMYIALIVVAGVAVFAFALFIVSVMWHEHFRQRRHHHERETK